MEIDDDERYVLTDQGGGDGGGINVSDGEGEEEEDGFQEL